MKPLRTGYQQDYFDTVEGDYTIVEGAYPNGATYSGDLKVIKDGPIYRIIWRTDDWSVTGIGLVRGEVFSCAWGQNLVTYTSTGFGLDGMWISASGGTGVEQLIGSSEPNGIYRIGSSVNAGGGGCGEVLVVPGSDYYRVAWMLRNESYTGVGIRIKDELAVAWGVGQALEVSAYIISEDGLEGVRALPGVPGVSIERAIRSTRMQ